MRREAGRNPGEAQDLQPGVAPRRGAAAGKRLCAVGHERETARQVASTMGRTLPSHQSRKGRRSRADFQLSTPVQQKDYPISRQHVNMLKKCNMDQFEAPEDAVPYAAMDNWEWEVEKVVRAATFWQFLATVLATASCILFLSMRAGTGGGSPHERRLHSHETSVGLDKRRKYDKVRADDELDPYVQLAADYLVVSRSSCENT